MGGSNTGSGDGSSSGSGDGETQDNSGLLSSLGDWFDGVVRGIAAVKESILSLPGQIVNGLIDGIKSLFIPDSESLNSVIQDYKNRLSTSFGIGSIDVSSALGAGTQIADQTGDVSVYGLGTFHVTVLDVSYLVSAVTTFRPYIRGLFVLFLALFNFNQFCGLIGVNIISVTGGGGDTKLIEGGKK